MSRMIRLGHQEVHVPPKEFGFWIAKKASCCRVHCGYDARAINGDDGVDGRFKHCLELAGLTEKGGVVWIRRNHGAFEPTNSMGPAYPVSFDHQ